MTLCELQRRMQLNIKYCIIGFLILLILGCNVYFLWKKRKEKNIKFILTPIFLILGINLIWTGYKTYLALSDRQIIYEIKQYANNPNNYYRGNNIPYYLESYKDLVPVKSYTTDGYGIIRVPYTKNGVNKYKVIATKCFHVPKGKTSILFNTDKGVQYKGVKFRIPYLYNKDMIFPLCLRENFHKDHTNCWTFKNKNIDIKEGLFIDVKSKAIYEVFDFYKTKPMTKEY